MHDKVNDGSSYLIDLPTSRKRSRRKRIHIRSSYSEMKSLKVIDHSDGVFGSGGGL